MLHPPPSASVPHLIHQRKQGWIRAWQEHVKKTHEDGYFLHWGSTSTNPDLCSSSQPRFSPGQSLPTSRDTLPGKGQLSSAAHCCTALSRDSGKAFLLPVDGIRRSKADARAPDPPLFPALGLLPLKSATATGSGEEGEEVDPASSIILPISEISHQQTLHPFHSKPLPHLWTQAPVLTRQATAAQWCPGGKFGMPRLPPVPFTLTLLLSLWMSPGFFFLSLTKQQRNIYYRKLFNGKGFYRAHNSKPQFIFHCALALCNWHLFETHFKVNMFVVQR